MKFPSHPAPTGFLGLVEAVKPLLPIPMLVVVCLLLWLFFRRTWVELDLESDALRERRRAELAERGIAASDHRNWDSRPLVALVLVSTVLMFHEYYGARPYFQYTLRPMLDRYAAAHISLERPDPLGLVRYDDLYGHGFWALTRVLGYVLPVFVWMFAYRKDSILDMGLRGRGFFAHWKMYTLFLVVVTGAMVIVARSPDFGSYYPFYKGASRSWWDLLLWESMYFAQFFALELFFRGWLLSVLKSRMGSAAIFVMTVPYCMIHFGKPYLEVGGAIVAGIALGSLAMKTKSIYQGFLLHITIALSMDLLALSHRSALPTQFWP